MDNKPKPEPPLGRGVRFIVGFRWLMVEFVLTEKNARRMIEKIEEQLDVKPSGRTAVIASVKRNKIRLRSAKDLFPDG